MKKRSPNIGLAVVLMGVSGSGKSTVGRSLAEALSWPYLEGDAFHSSESVEKMASGIALDDDDRWPWLERLAHAINQKGASQQGVVASCSALKRIYRDRLRAGVNGPLAFIHLTASQGELEQRVAMRPAHYMPTSLLKSQLAVLEPLGSDEMARTIHTDIALNELIRELADWLEKTVATLDGLNPENSSRFE